MKYFRYTLCLCACIVACTGCSQSQQVNAGRQAEFTVYSETTIDEIPDNTKKLRIWVPVPRSTGYQTITNVVIDSLVDPIFTTDRLYGNSMAFIELTGNIPKSVKITMSFDARRSELKQYKQTIDGKLMQRLTMPDKLGVVTEKTRSMAAVATHGRRTTIEKARGIYDYVLNHMEYNKETPGWGRGDTLRACEVGRGNCSDFHSLLISLARSIGIPARFFYGLALPKDKTEGDCIIHCWAEIYNKEAETWIPVDASEADKNPALKDYYFGTFDERRVTISMGRDITLEPAQEGDPLNFFIFPYAETDGNRHEHIKTRYTFRLR